MPAPQRRCLPGCGWEHECKLTCLQCGHLGDHDPRVKACRSSPQHKPTYVQTLRVTKKISYNPNSPSCPSGAATLVQHLATAQRATVIYFSLSPVAFVFFFFLKKTHYNRESHYNSSNSEWQLNCLLFHLNSYCFHQSRRKRRERERAKSLGELASGAWGGEEKTQWGSIQFQTKPRANRD